MTVGMEMICATAQADEEESEDEVEAVAMLQYVACPPEQRDHAAAVLCGTQI